MAGLLSRLFRSFFNQVVVPTVKDMSRRPQDDDHYDESPAEYRERKQYEAWIETTNASILRNEESGSSLDQLQVVKDMIDSLERDDRANLRPWMIAHFDEYGDERRGYQPPPERKR